MPTAARIATARALHRVFGEGRRVADNWDARLPKEEALLAQAILGHCLRKWGRLQAHGQSQLKNPDRGVPLGTQVALAMGFAQLAWLPGVAAHAAVNEAVDLVADDELGFQPHRGLVNALMRRAAADRNALAESLDALPAALDRTPFADRILDAALAPFGAPRDGDRESLWARLQQPPTHSFRAVREAHVPADMEADPVVPGCLRLRPGAEFPRAWLTSGAGLVQDRSSQALMTFRLDREPRRILDACAAPGGKTASLARRFPGASHFALERDPRRAEILRKNLAAWGVDSQIVVEDAEHWLRKGGKPFDLILLDAPCSGSGTLQKHPELVWLGDRLDLQDLTQRQWALLEAALGRLAPGGLLVYAVCSWLPEEGAAHRERLAHASQAFRSRPAWSMDTGTGPEATDFFRPHPLLWDGEGFQAFTLERP